MEYSIDQDEAACTDAARPKRAGLRAQSFMTADHGSSTELKIVRQVDSETSRGKIGRAITFYTYTNVTNGDRPER